MVHTLKGQWDCIVGDFEDKAAQRYQLVSYFVDNYSTYHLEEWHSFLALLATKMTISPPKHKGIKTL